MLTTANGVLIAKRPTEKLGEGSGGRGGGPTTIVTAEEEAKLRREAIQRDEINRLERYCMCTYMLSSVARKSELRGHEMKCARNAAKRPWEALKWNALESRGRGGQVHAAHF